MRDWHAPQFGASDVACAAGISPDTLQHWRIRGVVKLSPAENPARRRRRRRYTARTAAACAITRAFTQAGVGLGTAARWAEHIIDNHMSHDGSLERLTAGKWLAVVRAGSDAPTFMDADYFRDNPPTSCVSANITAALRPVAELFNSKD